MTTIETLSALQKRIREATGPDRELDAEIRRVFYPALADTLRPTLSLDACVALMRTVLPGCEWSRSYFRRFAIWKVSKRRTVGSVLSDDAEPLANDCLTFLDAIIAARIAEIEVKEKANAQ